MNNKNKNFWKILVVLLLSILHVCASAYTVNNAMNPLLILLLFTYTAWSEFYTYFIGGMIVQCVVTYFLARLILNWRNKKVWLISFAVCIFIQFLFCDFFTNYDSQLINLPIIHMYICSWEKSVCGIMLTMSYFSLLVNYYLYYYINHSRFWPILSRDLLRNKILQKRINNEKVTLLFTGVQIITSNSIKLDF